MKKYSYIFIFLIAFACQRKSNLVESFVPDYALNRFESTIKNYEDQDKKNILEAGRYLFYGSSSWYFWKNMEQNLAPLKVYNRGFGGSTIPELIHYVDRMVLPYQPKAIVVYAGENDLSGAKTKTAEQVLASYETLTSNIKQKLPNVGFYYVSMKLSPARRAKWEEMKKGNALIKKYCRQNGMTYIDINPLLFDKNGLVRGDLYTKDSLHINQKGYDMYSVVLKKALL